MSAKRGGGDDLKACADLKENELRQSDITLMTSMMNDTAVRESAVDETILQKRPSNPSIVQQQRFSQRPSTNIFANKERSSNV